MIQLNKLKSITKTLTVNFEGVGSLEVEYSPVAMAGDEVEALSQKINESKDRRQQLDCFAEMFVLVVMWWDLYDDEKPVGLTAENVKALPPFVLSTILSAIAKNESGGNGLAKQANV